MRWRLGAINADELRWLRRLLFISWPTYTNFILVNILPYEFFMFCWKSWRKFHRCVFSVKEGNELLVCLNINYKHQVLLQNLIVAHMLWEFIAFCTISLLVSATESYPESAPSIPLYIQLLRKIRLNFNVSSTSCSSKWSHPFIISSY